MLDSSHEVGCLDGVGWRDAKPDVTWVHQGCLGQVADGNNAGLATGSMHYISL